MSWGNVLVMSSMRPSTRKRPNNIDEGSCRYQPLIYINTRSKARAIYVIFVKFLLFHISLDNLFITRKLIKHFRMCPYFIDWLKIQKIAQSFLKTKQNQ